MMRARAFLAWTLMLLAGCTSAAQSQPTGSATPISPVLSYSPPNLPAAPSIEVPSGFAAFIYGRDLQRPTAMAFGPDGRLYVTELLGRIVVLPSPGSQPEVLVEGLNNPLGLVWRNRELFVSVKGQVLAYRLDETSSVEDRPSSRASHLAATKTKT